MHLPQLTAVVSWHTHTLAQQWLCVCVCVCSCKEKKRKMKGQGLGRSASTWVWMRLRPRNQRIWPRRSSLSAQSISSSSSASSSPSSSPGSRPSPASFRQGSRSVGTVAITCNQSVWYFRCVAVEVRLFCGTIGRRERRKEAGSISRRLNQASHVRWD